MNEVRTYFQRLTSRNKFERKSLLDLIAIRYVYMPMIRTRLNFYVPIHNSHSIRKQKNRKHDLPTGKPRILYKGLKPGVEDYKQPLHEETMAWLEQIIDELGIDVDAYLS
jgi:hypothetical protein